jgi:hypothetical protein
MWTRHAVGNRKYSRVFNDVAIDVSAPKTPTYALSHIKASGIGSLCPPLFAPHYVAWKVSRCRRFIRDTHGRRLFESKMVKHAARTSSEPSRQMSNAMRFLAKFKVFVFAFSQFTEIEFCRFFFCRFFDSVIAATRPGRDSERKDEKVCIRTRTLCATRLRNPTHTCLLRDDFHAVADLSSLKNERGLP